MFAGTQLANIRENVKLQPHVLMSVQSRRVIKQHLIRTAGISNQMLDA